MANSDTKTQPWCADRIVLTPFLVEKLGDESRVRELTENATFPALWSDFHFASHQDSASVAL